MPSQQFVEEMKQKLLQAKEKLEADLKGQHAHTEMGDSEEENADEVGPDEVSADVIAVIKADLEKISAALSKIEAGTYGTDSEGKEIPEARLRVLPWADKSI